MPSAGRLTLTVVAIVALAWSSPGSAQSPPRPAKKPPPGSPAGDAAPAGLVRLRLGALLPLTGPSAWYGEEMRHGLELAVAELSPPPRRAAPSPAPASAPAAAPEAAEPPGDDAATAPPEAGDTPGAPPLRVSLEVLDVRPLDVRQAAADFARLAAGGATVVFTASPTPTLAIHPLAAARDVLVVHQGLPSSRFPATSRTLVQTRPSVAARAEALAAYAWERGLRRLGILSAGDEFGKAVRAAITASWRDRGGSLPVEESLSLDAPDLAARLSRVARRPPEAMVLAFLGQDLGELARRLREAGYAGLLLGLDDDPIALLAAGPGLSDAVLLADAFVPEPDSRGARFAKTYEAKFGRAPSRFAANAYEAVSLLYEAAGRAWQEGRAPGGARLREALARSPVPSLYAGSVALRSDGSLGRPLALFRVEGGRRVFGHYVTPDGRPATEGARAAPGDAGG